MRKYLIATHGKFSNGLKDTLDIIIGIHPEVECICAYTDKDNIPINEKILKSVSKLSDSDELVVFTDILGGSVTNQFLQYLQRKNIYLVAGVNLPLIIEMVLSQEKNTKELIKSAIVKAKEGIVYVNDLLVGDK